VISSISFKLLCIFMQSRPLFSSYSSSHPSFASHNCFRNLGAPIMIKSTRPVGLNVPAASVRTMCLVKNILSPKHILNFRVSSDGSYVIPKVLILSFSDINDFSAKFSFCSRLKIKVLSCYFSIFSRSYYDWQTFGTLLLLIL
jgi:hypothetical protein